MLYRKTEYLISKLTDDVVVETLTTFAYGINCIELLKFIGWGQV